MQKDIITFDELINVFEIDKTSNNFKTAADKLLEAFTDWPTVNLTEPHEMISELKQEVNDRLTYDNLSNFLKKLKPQNDAWKMESLSNLLELFDFERNNNIDKEIELDVFMEKATNFVAFFCGLFVLLPFKFKPYTVFAFVLLALISKMVEERLYMSRPTYISPYYVKSSILLYHLTRLMAAFNPSSLEAFKPQLINDLKLLQREKNNTMEQILISTSLLRLGGETPLPQINSIAAFENSNQKKFVFFQARPAFWYRSPLKQIFLHVPYLNSQFYSPTYNKVLLLENLVLRD